MIYDLFFPNIAIWSPLKHQKTKRTLERKEESKFIQLKKASNTLKNNSRTN